MTEVLNPNPHRSLFDYHLEPVANKSILITGGATDIGRYTAILLSSQGANVMILGRHQHAPTLKAAEVLRRRHRHARSTARV